MNTTNHRYSISHQEDDERSEGELDSSISDDDTTVSKSQSEQTSQSWTKMLTEQNLSSIMSNALADNSQIIHIDDPIAQQSTNPLTYVFPPGTNVDEYFQRKQNQDKINRRDLKNLSHLLNYEKNFDLLRTILNIIGCRRAFQYAHQAIQLYQSNNESIKISDNGQIRTLGGVYFKMFLNDHNHHLITANEYEQIKKSNQQIQKRKKKKIKKHHVKLN